jgi:hypothetical protein
MNPGIYVKKKDYYLWGDKNNNIVTATSISEHFAEFADKSGFVNIEKVSLHSLRSGFIASAIFSNNLKSNNLETVLGNIAITAGWKLGGSFLQNYVKIETRKSIICNNVANYIELNQITNKELMNPQIRHNNNILFYTQL